MIRLTPQEKVVKASEWMTKLMGDPHPGLSTWNESVECAYQNLKDAVGEEEASRKERIGEGEPKFAKTYCSQCGGEFGPGDAGYSHCENHTREV